MFGPKYFLWRFNSQYQNLIDGIYSPIQFLGASVQFFIWFHLVSSIFCLCNVQAGKDWRQKEKGMQRKKWLENIRLNGVQWKHDSMESMKTWLNGHESEQTLGDSEE